VANEFSPLEESGAKLTVGSALRASLIVASSYPLRRKIRSRNDLNPNSDLPPRTVIAEKFQFSGMSDSGR
jgi:hypothetical protein